MPISMLLLAEAIGAEADVVAIVMPIVVPIDVCVDIVSFWLQCTTLGRSLLDQPAMSSVPSIRLCISGSE